MSRGTATARTSLRELRSDAARNRAELLRAATVTLHREGPSVPMSAIAAEAGVGVGTLYRHFPDRQRLLAELTDRSFEQVLVNAVDAEARGTSAVDSLRLFIEAAITQRNELVMPLHGGPAVVLPATRRTRTKIHETVRRIVDRGKADGTIRPDVDPFDVIALGAMVSQPVSRRGQSAAQWDATCRRVRDDFLRGLG